MQNGATWSITDLISLPNSDPDPISALPGDDEVRYVQESRFYFLHIPRFGKGLTWASHRLQGGRRCRQLSTGGTVRGKSWNFEELWSLSFSSVTSHHLCPLSWTRGTKKNCSYSMSRTDGEQWLRKIKAARIVYADKSENCIIITHVSGSRPRCPNKEIRPTCRDHWGAPLPPPLVWEPSQSSTKPLWKNQLGAWAVWWAAGSSQVSWLGREQVTATGPIWPPRGRSTSPSCHFVLFTLSFYSKLTALTMLSLHSFHLWSQKLLLQSYSDFSW